MNRAHDCKHLREQLFDYRRAELSALDAAQFEEEVAACPDCAARTGRLIGLLDLAAEAPADVWLDTPAEEAAGDPLGGTRCSPRSASACSPCRALNTRVLSRNPRRIFRPLSHARSACKARWPSLARRPMMMTMRSRRVARLCRGSSRRRAPRWRSAPRTSSAALARSPRRRSPRRSQRPPTRSPLIWARWPRRRACLTRSRCSPATARRGRLSARRRATSCA